MARIALSSAPTGNGYQGTIAFSRAVSISSAETFPTLVEAITGAAIKVLELPGQTQKIDRSERAGSASISSGICTNAKLREPSKKQREEALTDLLP
jgi:hypothetical protein